jgi:hypothetical protein
MSLQIQSADEFTIETIEIASIKRDLVVRKKGTSAAVVADYARAMAEADNPAELMPPIVVFEDPRRGGGVRRLSDGAHRIEAALANGFTTIRAEIRKGDRKAALEHAVSSGSKFGLRFSTLDKRHACELMLKAFPDLDHATLGRMIGVDGKTVTATQKRLSKPTEIPSNDGPNDADTAIASKLEKQIERLIAQWPDTRHDALRALLTRWSTAIAESTAAE